MLEVVGVSADEELVYDFLVSRSSATASELADACQLSAHRISRALAGLAEKGLVQRFGGRPRRFGSLAPDVALESLAQTKEAEIRQARLQIHRLASRYQEFRTVEQSPVTEVIKGRDNVHRTIEELQKVARREVRMMSRPPYSRVPGRGNKVEYAKLAEQVTYRGIWDTTALEIPSVPKIIQADIRRGEKTRVFAGVPIKLVLVDDKYGLIPMIRSPQPSDAAILVHRSEVLDGLSALFERVWDSARPVRTVQALAKASEADAFTAQQQKFLELLANGYKDESIAKALRMSRRTVQRQVRALLQALGADTRFQAGMEAARRGWL